MFTSITHRGHSFKDAVLIDGPTPIVVQPQGNTYLFTLVLDEAGHLVQTGGPRVALRWAESAGMTIPDTFLHGRDGRHYAPNSRGKSPWSNLDAGERRVIPLDALVKRLWPSDRQARIIIEGGQLIVEVPNV